MKTGRVLFSSEITPSIESDSTPLYENELKKENSYQYQDPFYHQNHITKPVSLKFKPIRLTPRIYCYLRLTRTS